MCTLTIRTSTASDTACICRRAVPLSCSLNIMATTVPYLENSSRGRLSLEKSTLQSKDVTLGIGSDQRQATVAMVTDVNTDGKFDRSNVADGAVMLAIFLELFFLNRCNGDALKSFVSFAPS